MDRWVVELLGCRFLRCLLQCQELSVDEVGDSYAATFCQDLCVLLVELRCPYFLCVAAASERVFLGFGDQVFEDGAQEEGFELFCSASRLFLAAARRVDDGRWCGRREQGKEVGAAGDVHVRVRIRVRVRVVRG